VLPIAPRAIDRAYRAPSSPLHFVLLCPRPSSLLSSASPGLATQPRVLLVSRCPDFPPPLRCGSPNPLRFLARLPSTYFLLSHFAPLCVMITRLHTFDIQARFCSITRASASRFSCLPHTPRAPSRETTKGKIFILAWNWHLREQISKC
jgi:hypothetical protein